MTFYSSKGDRVPDHIHDMAKQAREGKVDRREFLALATAFGASTAMAYGMLGLAVPMEAKAQEPKKGGVLKNPDQRQGAEGSAHGGLVGNRQCAASVA